MDSVELETRAREREQVKYLARERERDNASEHKRKNGSPESVDHTICMDDSWVMRYFNSMRGTHHERTHHGGSRVLKAHER